MTSLYLKRSMALRKASKKLLMSFCFLLNLSAQRPDLFKFEKTFTISLFFTISLKTFEQAYDNKKEGCVEFSIQPACGVICASGWA